MKLINQQIINFKINSNRTYYIADVLLHLEYWSWKHFAFKTTTVHNIFKSSVGNGYWQDFNTGNYIDLRYMELFKLNLLDRKNLHGFLCSEWDAWQNGKTFTRVSFVNNLGFNEIKGKLFKIKKPINCGSVNKNDMVINKDEIVTVIDVCIQHTPNGFRPYFLVLCDNYQLILDELSSDNFEEIKS
jgi:hypothetical protein